MNFKREETSQLFTQIHCSHQICSSLFLFLPPTPHIMDETSGLGLSYVQKNAKFEIFSLCPTFSPFKSDVSVDIFPS